MIACEPDFTLPGTEPLRVIQLDSKVVLVLDRRTACLYDLDPSGIAVRSAIYKARRLKKQTTPPWRMHIGQLDKLFVPGDISVGILSRYYGPAPLPPWPRDDDDARNKEFDERIAGRGVSLAFYIKLRPMTESEIIRAAEAGNRKPLAALICSGKELGPTIREWIAAIVDRFIPTLAALLRSGKKLSPEVLGVTADIVRFIQRPNHNPSLPGIERAPGIFDNSIEACEEIRLCLRNRSRSQDDIDRKALTLASREHGLGEDGETLRNYMSRSNNAKSRFTPRVCDLIGLPPIPPHRK